MPSSIDTLARVNTFSADVEETGLCHIPDVFAEHFRPLAAALDWARVYNTDGPRSYGPLAQELAAAARYARALANECEAFASAADAARID